MAFHLKIRDIFDIRGCSRKYDSGVVRVGDSLVLVSSTAKFSVRVASIEKFKQPPLVLMRLALDRTLLVLV